MKVGNRESEVGSFSIKKWLVKILIVWFFTLNTACQKERTVQPAFYHWQTNLELSQTEQAYLDSLAVQKLYAKFFDVEWDAAREMPVPLAEVEIGEIAQLDIVPCIFITNRTFQNLSDEKIPWLAERVDEKLRELWQQLPGQALREVQFDCDWTASTRDRFFQFLENFKAKNADIQLSATIRLHQLRDHEQTGVPPVDKGMLMFYNTGDLESWQEENSILNMEIAKSYLQSDFRRPDISYQIPLDLALPIFAWGVLFRDGRMIRLINDLRPEQLTDTTRFQKLADNRFEVTKSTYLDGYYLYKDDHIRTEAIDPALLLQATDILKNKLKNDNLTVAFYHLDTTTIKYFPYEVLESVCEKFSSQ